MNPIFIEIALWLSFSANSAVNNDCFCVFSRSNFWDSYPKAKNNFLLLQIEYSTPAATPFSLQVLGYYAINKRFSVGVGTGLSIYEKVLIPLFADTKFLIKNLESSLLI